MRTVEKRGKSVNEAVEAALAELGCSRDEAVVEIIEAPEKKFLGLFAGRPARVKVSFAAETAVVSLARDTGEESKEKREPSAEAPRDVRQLVETILGKMGIDYEIDTFSPETDRIRINFVGRDMGLLIGHKGETLNALQMITGLIYNRRAEEKQRIILDVENYRLNREKTLEALALRMADKVKQTKKSVILRPMNAQERRIVHTALQQEPQLTTYSVGDDPNRKVVIALKIK
jgi:spoIIIJ-associated protein